MGKLAVSLVASAALCSGACSPSSKPVGYIAGTLFALGGGAMVLHAETTDCPRPKTFNYLDSCELTRSTELAVGPAVLLMAAVALGIAIMSPGAKPAPAPPPERSPESPSPESPSPESPPPLEPSARSPSAPASSPLAFP
jgi:hypothetical protein